VRVELFSNGLRLVQQNLDRPACSSSKPTCRTLRARDRDRRLAVVERPGDGRPFTVNISMIRLIPRD